MQNFWGAIFTQVYGLIADGTPRPMALVALLSALLGLLVGVIPFALARRAGRLP
jgi:DHA1 family bicyclomycin/chloramphenicol resistance-like MFS transporter